ncbi:RHS repeat-associated core domain-containing protein [Burkholderia cepacia]|nr:RHS repeat-associated core domain-containing protein [Burkholderia cepacia]
MHHNRYRYYDPEVGWFVSKDPIGLRGGLNNYSLAPNSIHWVDPLGLRCKKGRFATSDGAAKAVLTRANPKSIRDNLEYGGLIYKMPGGGYGFTKALEGVTKVSTHGTPKVLYRNAAKS